MNTTTEIKTPSMADLTDYAAELAESLRGVERRLWGVYEAMNGPSAEAEKKLPPEGKTSGSLFAIKGQISKSMDITAQIRGVLADIESVVLPETCVEESA